MKWMIVFLAGIVTMQGARAASVMLDLPGDAPSHETVDYDCGDRKVSATYVNAGENALAVLKIGDRVVVTANVLAGSGARYAGQELVWWTKGDEATLYDVRKGEDDPGVICRKL